MVCTAENTFSFVCVISWSNPHLSCLQSSQSAALCNETWMYWWFLNIKAVAGWYSSWEKYNFDVAEIFWWSARWSMRSNMLPFLAPSILSSSMRVFLRWFDGGPKKYVLASYFVGSLLTSWSYLDFIFSSYKRWQFITVVTSTVTSCFNFILPWQISQIPKVLLGYGLENRPVCNFCSHLQFLNLYLCSHLTELCKQCCLLLNMLVHALEAKKFPGKQWCSLWVLLLQVGANHYCLFEQCSKCIFQPLQHDVLGQRSIFQYLHGSSC